MESYIEEFQKERDKKAELIVTVDGFAGAGKGTLAKHISERLDLKHFSASDVFYSIAEDRNLSDIELSQEAEKEVDLAVDRKTLSRALKSSCVIDSRISSWVLGSYADLRIRLEADVEERGKRLGERESKDLEEAVEIVEKRDEEDTKRYRKYYGLDMADLEIYDLIIDNTDLGIEEQKQLVDKALKQRFPERFNGKSQ